VTAATLHQVLVLSAILFGIGMVGVVIRRNAIAVFMSVEIMLNSANLAVLAFGLTHGAEQGHSAGILIFTVMTVAAVEVAIGLAILVAVFYDRDSIMLDEIDQLKG
jgi:NADH-quinone oxidoreductase subunit K